MQPKKMAMSVRNRHESRISERVLNLARRKRIIGPRTFYHATDPALGRSDYRPNVM